MSLYDKSSLVLIPSGTKTGKVFSQKPVSGDGDFTFTRASAATRVNADGNIEKETSNLLLQSNNFDTTWVKNAGATLVSGQSGYDGLNDAWRINVTTTSNSGLYQYISPTSSGVNTISLYAKAGDINYIGFTDFAGTNWYIWFDLSNGTIASQSGYIDSSITDVGGGWYRLSMTSTNLVIFQIKPSSVATNPSSSAGYIFIQDAQAEQGLVARDYIETTTAAVYGGITDNTPRLDYTDSSCPALLLEPQRTNFVTQSEYLGASDWIKTYVGITANATTSPEGVANADFAIPTTTNGLHKLRFNLSSVTGLYTQSIYAKQGGYKNLLVWNDNTGGGIGVNLDDLSIFRNQNNSGYDVQDVGNGWVRISVTHNYSSQAMLPSLYIYDNSATPAISFAGDGTSGIYIYGAQQEEGSYATSYIPTYGSSVTRNLEFMIVTGLDTNSIITDNDSWSAFFEVELLGNESPNDKIQLSDNSNTPRAYLYHNIAGVAGTGWSGSEPVGLNTNIKIMYRANSSTNISFFENGVNEETFTTTGEALTFNRVNFYGSNGAFRIKRAMLFPTALTDQEAIDLTTI